MKIDRKLHGMRIDLALVAAEIGLSRRKIRRVLDIGGVYINKRRVRVASRVVNVGDHIELVYSDKALAATSKMEKGELPVLEIIYEDKFLLAINKPPGIPVQATKAQSVYNIEKMIKDQRSKRESRSKSENLQLVHRLDKETTGVLLFAKNSASMKYLAEQFRQRLVEKHYLAVVRGALSPLEQVVSCQLSAIDKRTGRVVVMPRGGRYSETRFKCLAYEPSVDLSLVSCFPKTGRSHQLRVHLDSIGCAILGDKQYGESLDKGRWLNESAQMHHLLHAYELAISPSPHQAELRLRATLPPSFNETIEKLSWHSLISD